MPVEVAAGAVVVLSRPRVGVPSQDLGVSEWNACVEGVVTAEACRGRFLQDQRS